MGKYVIQLSVKNWIGSLSGKMSSFCSFALQLAIALVLLWIRGSSGQQENCNEFTLKNNPFTVCLNSNQRLALGARPILVCDLTSETGDVDVCSFYRWELNKTEITISLPNYQTAGTYPNQGVGIRINTPSPAVSGVYRCSYYCFEDAYIIYSEIPMPYFPIVEFTTPDNLVYWSQVGSTVTLNCSLTNYNVFLWKYGNDTVLPVHLSGSPRQELNGTNLILKELVASDSDTYHCTAKNTVSSNRYITAHLIVYQLPEIVKLSDPIVTTEGNRTEMTCTVLGVPKPSIVWSKDTELIFDGRLQEEIIDVDAYTLRSTLVIKHTAGSDQGTYHCTAFNLNSTTGMRIGTIREDVELTVAPPSTTPAVPATVFIPLLPSSSAAASSDSGMTVSTTVVVITLVVAVVVVVAMMVGMVVYLKWRSASTKFVDLNVSTNDLLLSECPKDD